MGAKFYRGADKPKKIRKRFSQTRSWFRTLKWVACMFHFSTFPANHFYLRSRSSKHGRWSPIQGKLGILNRSTLAPRSQEIRHWLTSPLQASYARQEPIPTCCCRRCNRPLILIILLIILR
jgi:hypothetical protein